MDGAGSAIDMARNVMTAVRDCWLARVSWPTINQVAAQLNRSGVVMSIADLEWALGMIVRMGLLDEVDGLYSLPKTCPLCSNMWTGK